MSALARTIENHHTIWDPRPSTNHSNTSNKRKRSPNHKRKKKRSGQKKMNHQTAKITAILRFGGKPLGGGGQVSARARKGLISRHSLTSARVYGSKNGYFSETKRANTHFFLRAVRCFFFVDKTKFNKQPGNGCKKNITNSASFWK